MMLFPPSSLPEWITSSVPGLMVKVTVLYQGTRYKKKKTDNVKLCTNPSFSQALIVQLTPQHNLHGLSFVIDVCKVRLSSTEVSRHVGYYSSLSFI